MIRLLLYVCICFGLLALVIFVPPKLHIGKIGYFLVVNEEPLASDGIVILLGGNTPDRVFKAWQLFKEGISKKLIFGSGYVDNSFAESLPEGFIWPKSSTKYLVALKSLKVARKDIQIVPTDNGYDTRSELTAIAAFARSKGWNRLTLVSSAAHTRRVRLIWSRIAPDIETEVVAADAPGFDKWWTNGRYIRAVGYEYAALSKELTLQVIESFRKLSTIIQGFLSSEKKSSPLSVSPSSTPAN